MHKQRLDFDGGLGRLLVSVPVVLGCVVLDQATKMWAVSGLPVFDDVAHRLDDGRVAMGWILHVVPPDQSLPIATVGLVIMMGLWSTRISWLPLSMMTGGGASNMTELALNDCVVDFIGIKTSANTATIINLADILIVSGGLMCVICLLTGRMTTRDVLIGSLFIEPGKAEEAKQEA